MIGADERTPLIEEQSPRKRVNVWRYISLFSVGFAILYLSHQVAFSVVSPYWKLLLHDSVSFVQMEEAYIKTLQETNYARNWSLKYTEHPHLAGTALGLAEWTQTQFKEFGLTNVEIKPYYVYLSFPMDHLLSVVSKHGKVLYRASLEEDEIPEDPSSWRNNSVPTFHGYSASGNVTAPFFYANYGRKEDFEKLASDGIDMDGKIAIVRYGYIYRGLKVKFAQEHGCVGVVMYLDPGDDLGVTPANGFKQYPEGPARHESSVQRGSVMYLSYGPGDPTTPGYASNSPDVERQDPYKVLPCIPSLPISYREVLPILQQLKGPIPKEKEWIGELPGYNYSIGPTDISTQLNLYNYQKYNVTPIWNVLGEIKGIFDDEVVIIGNHRDSWAGSAGDPNSGSATMLEIIRGFQAIKRTHPEWKPLRTIIFASFDAEEQALIGSTEWAEDMLKSLQKKVIAYLNMDVAVSGSALMLGLSPVLNKLLMSTAKKVAYPKLTESGKGITLYEHYQTGPMKGQIDILGSGSDFTVFLEHLGIPSLDVGFETNSNKDPVYHYHSNYDLFYWMDTMADPGFKFHNTMAQYLGLVLLELSSREVINFDVTTYATSIHGYFNDTLKTVPKEWFKKRTNFTLIHRNHDNPHFEDLVDLTHAALLVFTKMSIKFDKYKEQLQLRLDKNDKLSFWEKVWLTLRLKHVNFRLKYLERHFLNNAGLKDRSWFKHIIFASGRHTGYEGQLLPAIREAIEDNMFEDAVLQINILLKTIAKVTVILLL